MGHKIMASKSFGKTDYLDESSAHSLFQPIKHYFCQIIIRLYSSMYTLCVIKIYRYSIWTVLKLTPKKLIKMKKKTDQLKF